MKSAVFDDGLLHVALSAVGTLRHGALGHLSLLVQSTGYLVIPAAIRAFTSLGRPRSSDVVFGTSRHQMTSASLPARTNTSRHVANNQPYFHLSSKALRFDRKCHATSTRTTTPLILTISTIDVLCKEPYQYMSLSPLHASPSTTVSSCGSLRFLRVCASTWLVF